MQEYPVIIVGSGPAGSACAKALKNEGIDSLVIEKDKLPRNKTCSGFLFGQAQVLIKEYFGMLPPEDVYCYPKIFKADNMVEWSKGNGYSNFLFELSKDGHISPKDYLNTWRSKLDYWLLKESGSAYSDDCKFVSFTTENGKIKVEICRNNDDRDFLYCSYLIGADGGGSRLRVMLDPSFSKISPEVVIYQTYNRFSDTGNLQDDRFYVFREPQIGDAISVVQRKDDLLALGVCGFKGRSMKKSMEVFKKFVSDNFKVVFKEMERDEGCVMKMAPPSLGKDNVLLTGEAAGLLYLNGEGISAAIDSGYKAGKSVAQVINNGGNALEVYGKEIEGILKHMNRCIENNSFFVA